MASWWCWCWLCRCIPVKSMPPLRPLPSSPRSPLHPRYGIWGPCRTCSNRTTLSRMTTFWTAAWPVWRRRATCVSRTPMGMATATVTSRLTQCRSQTRTAFRGVISTLAGTGRTQRYSCTMLLPPPNHPNIIPSRRRNRSPRCNRNTMAAPTLATHLSSPDARLLPEFSLPFVRHKRRLISSTRYLVLCVVFCRRQARRDE